MMTNPNKMWRLSILRKIVLYFAHFSYLYPKKLNRHPICKNKRLHASCSYFILLFETNCTTLCWQVVRVHPSFRLTTPSAFFKSAVKRPTELYFWFANLSKSCYSKPFALFMMHWFHCTKSTVYKPARLIKQICWSCGTISETHYTNE